MPDYTTIYRGTPGATQATDALRDLLDKRRLLWVLAVREFRVRYKQTALGVAWALVHPIALMLIFTAIFSRVLGVGSERLPYPLFSYAGLLPWTYLAASATLATNSVVKQVELITKIWFPREILPLATVVVSVFDFFIALAVFVVLMLGYGIRPAPTVLWLPVLILIQCLLTVGVALFVSALNVRYRDLRYLVPLALQLWLYASPVIYSVEAIPERFRLWYALNPMAGLIEGYRAVLLHHTSPDAVYLALSLLGAVLILCGGWTFFHRAESYFADDI